MAGVVQHIKDSHNFFTSSNQPDAQAFPALCKSRGTDLVECPRHPVYHSPNALTVYTTAEIAALGVLIHDGLYSLGGGGVFLALAVHLGAKWDIPSGRVCGPERGRKTGGNPASGYAGA